MCSRSDVTIFIQLGYFRTPVILQDTSLKSFSKIRRSNQQDITASNTTVRRTYYYSKLSHKIKAVHLKIQFVTYLLDFIKNLILTNRVFPERGAKVSISLFLTNFAMAVSLALLESIFRIIPSPELSNGGLSGYIRFRYSTVVHQNCRIS